MAIGTCYFPEHWPPERWATDIERMAEAGIEYVRMGEFAWERIEPERGTFDFEWLDTALSLIDDHGLEAILCTPTATPPKWLVDEYPEIHQRDLDGTVRGFGSRRHYCFNSARYRAETERIVSILAERYADHPAIAGWQTDNEFGCHRTVRCYCDECASAFRTWLRERYDDIDHLNEAWGNAFWSQGYPSFAAIDPPQPTPAEQHPSRTLAYARFSSDSVVEYNKVHTRVLRETNPEWFVTHNFMGHFPTLNAYDVSDALDLVSWDSYPTGFVQDRRDGEATVDELRAGDPDQVGLNHDLYRGALGQPFWVMEQQPGDVNWPPRCPQPAEGAMRLWAHHAAAHGADAVLYFRWRRCLSGQEQYHAGLLKQDGSPDRGHADAAQAAEEFDRLGEFGSVDAPVAVLHDYDSLWALSEQPHSPDFDYWSLVDAFYGAVRSRGVQVDVVDPATSLSNYDVVIAPSLYLMTEELADRLTAYVEDGGELLIGPRSGSKDHHNTLRPEPQPGPLASLVGATVDQHESVPDRMETRVRETETERSFAYRTWAEWLEPGEATVRMRYEHGPGADAAAVVEHAAGDGTVTYSGVWPQPDLADELVTACLTRGDVAQTDRLPTGVRVGVRGDRTWVVNFTSDHYEIDANGDWLVGDSALKPFGCAVAENTPIEQLRITTVDP